MQSKLLVMEREIAEERERLLSGTENGAGADSVHYYDGRAAVSGDPVHHPAHYAGDGIECIEVIRQLASQEELQGFCRFNALKYLWRLGKKGNAAEDAAKAEVYCRWLKEACEK